MKINQIIFALLLIGSQSVQAQESAGTAMNIEELTITASVDTSEAGPVEKMKDQNQFESDSDEEATGKQQEWPATMNEVASGLQSKLDQRIKMNFERQNTVHVTFAIAY